jgi:hypothetical protein
MMIPGRVKDGVVILDDGARIPEGQEVTVLIPDGVPVAPQKNKSSRHSVLSIPTVNVGRIIRPLTADDDLLDEMLEALR